MSPVNTEPLNLMLFLSFSFSFLWGPYSHLVHLFSKERLPFTLVYFTTLLGELNTEYRVIIFPAGLSYY